MSIETRRTGFYNSQAWKDTRRNYKQSVGGLCEVCLAKGIIRPADVVHHKIPLNAKNIQNLDISLGWNNLQALCRDCHDEAHEEFYRKKRKIRYKIAPDGRVLF